MLMGRTDGLPEFNSQKDLLISEPILEEIVEDEDANSSSQILYTASFDELANKYLQYDTIIWFSISLLLILAWGVGILMLLYLPIKRYILQKDIASRRLYVTPTEIVYKVRRPSFVPCWKAATIERRVPLSLVIDIIIEQGGLLKAYQSLYSVSSCQILISELQQGVNLSLDSRINESQYACSLSYIVKFLKRIFFFGCCLIVHCCWNTVTHRGGLADW